MEIDRAAATVVNNAEPQQAQGVQLPAPTSTSSEGGKRPLSFRDIEGATQTDLDSMIGDQPHTKVKPSKEEPEDEDDDLDEDDDEGVDSDEDSENEEPEDEEGDDEEEESDDEEEEKESEEGDFDPEDLKKEFDEEGKVTVKVNGKLKKYTLHEMKTLVASGAHTLEQRNSFVAEQKQWKEKLGEEQAKLSFLNSKITPAWEKLKEKNFEGALLELSSAQGLSKLDVKRRIRDQMLPVIAERLGMTDSEIRQRLDLMKDRNAFLDTTEENMFWKEETSRLAEERRKALEPDENQQIAQQIQAKQIEHGISNNDLKWAYEYAQRSTPQGQEPNITVDSLVSLVLNKRICDSAIEAIVAVRPKLVKDQSFVDRVVKKLSHNSDWTMSQTARWVEKQARKRASVSENNEKELARDISRKALKTKSKTSFENPNAGQKKAMKFSDFGDDLSNDRDLI